MHVSGETPEGPQPIKLIENMQDNHFMMSDLYLYK